MKSYNCLIVDDEELARRLLVNYCAKLPELRVVGQAANPLEALPLLREHAVDILFLDIQMPEMKGTDLLRILKDAPAVILTTAYSEYALEGYDLDVTDYLLKPFAFERFLRAVHKAMAPVSPTPAPPIPGPAPAAAPPEAAYQIVRADHKLHRIANADILYIESMREYVIYHTAAGKTMALGSLKKLAAELPAGFVRVHKSFIVARDKVARLEGNRLVIGGAEIPVGASYRAAVLRALF